MQNLRLEDDLSNMMNVDLSELDAMNEHNITAMLENIEELIGEQMKTIQVTEEGEFISKYENHPSKYSYPIKENLYVDINYHARKCMYVNLHICPYHVRLTTDGTPFVQYIMLKKNDRENKKLTDHENNYMDFVKKTYFDHHTTYINFNEEINKLMRIIMLSYGKIVKNNIQYDGFIKHDNDFYVFVNISDTWINYHYLNMHDPLWLVSIYEISVLKEVCSVPVCKNVSHIFEKNIFLTKLYQPNSQDVFPIPVTGFTIEDKKMEDIKLFCGTSMTNHRDLIDVFRYFYDYNDCCNVLLELDEVKQAIDDKNNSKKNEVIKTKLIMRSYIIYDISVSYDEYIKLTQEIKEKNILIIDYIDDNSKRGGFITTRHSSQTPINTHNVIL